MIRLDNVSKFYYSKGVIATGFSRVSLNFEMGEFVAITGESGSGKSTLLNVISGLDTYEEGEMYIDGEETSHYTEKDFEDYRRRYIGNIFQNFNLVNSYTVYQNIELVMLLNGSKRGEVKERVNELIEKVGLTEYKNTKASKLSGGQKQRVAIARALAKDTPIIIADEPTGNLDTESAAGIIELLSNIAKDKLVVIVTHNYDQVEPYVTRKIKMHDGKVLEDLKLKQHEEIAEKPATSYKNIRPLSQVRLGVRNSFNIPVKFFLLTFVFLFIAVAVTSELAIFKHEEYESSINGYNYYFNNNSDDRIVIKKNDKSSFSDEDYEKILAIPNVDRVVENDLLVDNMETFTDEKDFWYSGTPLLISEADFDKPDVGEMPKADDEIVLEGSRDSYYLSESYEEDFGSIIGKTVIFNNYWGGGAKKLKIVGIKYTDDSVNPNWGDGAVYVSESVMDDIKYMINFNYSNTSVLFEEKKYSNDLYAMGELDIYPNGNVPSGEIYVGSDFVYTAKDAKTIGKEMTVSVKNIYFEDSFTAKITKNITKSNFNKYTGMEKSEYEYYSNAIFVSAEDYNKLFEKDAYQSSVFVKDPLEVDAVVAELEKMGIDPLVLSDANYNDGSGIIIRLMTIAVTVGLAVALFFISYFVIRIILKSRNVYYSTVRMLGANVGVARNLLMIDLVTDANIACVLTFGIFKILEKEFPRFFIIEAINTYMGMTDYIAIYAIVVCISALVSLRYSSKLFQKSTMNTYKEEV